MVGFDPMSVRCSRLVAATNLVIASSMSAVGKSISDRPGKSHKRKIDTTSSNKLELLKFSPQPTKTHEAGMGYSEDFIHQYLQIAVERSQFATKLLQQIHLSKALDYLRP